METLKIFTALFFIAGCYLFAGYDDYHKKFDKEVLVRYNCDVTVDVPNEVIEKCKFSERNYVYIKTYQEEYNR
jgi:hypothetical protein